MGKPRPERGTEIKKKDPTPGDVTYSMNSRERGNDPLTNEQTGTKDTSSRTSKGHEKERKPVSEAPHINPKKKKEKSKRGFESPK